MGPLQERNRSNGPVRRQYPGWGPGTTGPPAIQGRAWLPLTTLVPPPASTLRRRRPRRGSPGSTPPLLSRQPHLAFPSFGFRPVAALLPGVFDPSSSSGSVQLRPNCPVISSNPSLVPLDFARALADDHRAIRLPVPLPTTPRAGLSVPQILGEDRSRGLLPRSAVRAVASPEDAVMSAGGVGVNGPPVAPEDYTVLPCLSRGQEGNKGDECACPAWQTAAQGYRSWITCLMYFVF
ncbi:uncharacterized protein [Triticum aestivum]|uniref:uncharacterized protein isoform X2 n=1 Tax=Triticum aestivum TaxID=4565 RepID=UPI001D00541A|nr:uncharacterized protein LOC123048665 isoform X2 [Triticum aestivum]